MNIEEMFTTDKIRLLRDRIAKFDEATSSLKEAVMLLHFTSPGISDLKSAADKRLHILYELLGRETFENDLSQITGGE